MIFSIVTLLPTIFQLTVDTTKLFDGTATEEEWKAVLDDLTKVVNGIPELSGFAVMISGLIKIAEFAIPVIKDSFKVNSFANTSGIEFKDLNEAEASLRILKHVSNVLDERVKDAEFNGESLSDVLYRDLRYVR